MNTLFPLALVFSLYPLLWAAIIIILIALAIGFIPGMDSRFKTMLAVVAVIVLIIAILMAFGVIFPGPP